MKAKKEKNVFSWYCIKMPHIAPLTNPTVSCQRRCDPGVIHKWQQMYLALVRVEVLCLLPLVVRDAFQRSAVVPVTSVVITQDAENSVSLQCPMTTHHQPPLSWVVALLQCKDIKNMEYIQRKTINNDATLILKHKRHLILKIREAFVDSQKVNSGVVAA